jgi:glutathione S-transferase
MSNNITLYHCEGTPNSVKITLTLEELGLKYTTQTVDITKNEQKEPWFLEINPNGRVPALKDGDLRIFESGAIMLYLTDKYDDENKISYAHGTDEYYEMLSWLMFQMGGVGPMQGILLIYQFTICNC